jgi:hypothetical protein
MPIGGIGRPDRLWSGVIPSSSLGWAAVTAVSYTIVDMSFWFVEFPVAYLAVAILTGVTFCYVRGRSGAEYMREDLFIPGVLWPITWGCAAFEIIDGLGKFANQRGRTAKERKLLRLKVRQDRAAKRELKKAVDEIAGQYAVKRPDIPVG